MKKKLIFRVDGSKKIGTGHVARCMTLAKALLKFDVDAEFIIKETESELITNIKSQGFDVLLMNSSLDLIEDAQFLKAQLLKRKVHGVIVDGYRFDIEYLRSIRDHVDFLLSIDDLAEGDFISDMILNQNINAKVELYENKTIADIELLLGSEYALLRDEFIKTESRAQLNQDIKNVLVTFGGADPFNVTQTIVKVLIDIKGVNITVVVGEANAHRNEIKAIADQSTQHIQILENVVTMSEVMKEADLAICSGGSTIWELMYMGVPTITTILADNQVQSVTTLEEQGYVVNLGWYNQLNEITAKQTIESLIRNLPKREEMVSKGKNLIDGNGSSRVAERISYKLNQMVASN